MSSLSQRFRRDSRYIVQQCAGCSIGASRHSDILLSLAVFNVCILNHWDYTYLRTVKTHVLFWWIKAVKCWQFSLDLGPLDSDREVAVAMVNHIAAPVNIQVIELTQTSCSGGLTTLLYCIDTSWVDRIGHNPSVEMTSQSETSLQGPHVLPVKLFNHGCKRNICCWCHIISNLEPPLGSFAPGQHTRPWCQMSVITQLCLSLYYQHVGFYCNTYVLQETNNQSFNLIVVIFLCRPLFWNVFVDVH